jgi:hypothetical protein
LKIPNFFEMSRFSPKTPDPGPKVKYPEKSLNAFIPLPSLCLIFCVLVVGLGTVFNPELQLSWFHSITFIEEISN